MSRVGDRLQGLPSGGQAQGTDRTPLLQSNTRLPGYLLGAAWSLELSVDWKFLARHSNYAKDTRGLQTAPQRAKERFQKGNQSSRWGGVEGKLSANLLKKRVVVATRSKTFADAYLISKSLGSNASKNLNSNLRLWIFRRTKSNGKIRLYHLA